MTDDDKRWRPRRQRRRHTYYKVQTFDERSLAWIDEKSAFDDVASAGEFISGTLSGKKTRIIVVEGARRYPLDG